VQNHELGSSAPGGWRQMLESEDRRFADASQTKLRR
jgi:hypothetical protein